MSYREAISVIREVDLISYLPAFMRDFKEIAELFKAEDEEFKLAWKAVEAAFSDLNLTTATESGISRREKMLGIQPKDRGNLDERRFTILSKVNVQTPFTKQMLCDQLELLCGKDNYFVEVDCDTYTVNVMVGLVAKNSFDDVADLLERFIPANMIINLSLKFNRHEMFSTQTNAELAKYTHSQLRNEVLNTYGRINRKL